MRPSARATAFGVVDVPGRAPGIALVGADRHGARAPTSREEMRCSLLTVLVAVMAAAGCSDDGDERGVDADVASDPVDAPDAGDAGPDIVEEPDIDDGDADVADVFDASPPDTPDAPGDADTTPDPDVEVDADADVDTTPDVGPPALAATPCNFVYFDPTGRGVDTSILLGNTGDGAITVTGFRVPEHAARSFAFDSPALPFEIEAAETAPITLRYVAGYPLVDSTTEWIVTYLQEDVERELVCSARQNPPPDGCGLVDVDLSIVGDPLERSGSVLGWGAPLDTVLLSARALGDPIVDVFWRFASGPSLATRTVGPDPEAPDDPLRRHYVLTTPGSYSVCVEVAIEDGDFCDQCAQLSAEAPTGVWVELFWDEIEGDADLDLHGTLIGGAWFDEDNDEWGGNPTDGWGTDDTGTRAAAESAGPESLRLTRECQWLALGAHHAGGDGSASPVLRVYRDGEFLGQITGPALVSGEFWDAGRVHVESDRVLVVDEVLTDVVPGEVVPPATDSMRLSGLCGS